MDQIFTVKELLEKYYEFNIDVHQLFIDLLQAYDSIKREALYQVPPTRKTGTNNRTDDD